VSDSDTWKLQVVVVDARSGQAHADVSDPHAPSESKDALMAAIGSADVLIEVSAEGIWVKRGVEHGVVTLIKTKSAEGCQNQM
jgi:hypothetical protein